MLESLVSVVIPCYNVENKMIRFMESMLSQTYKKLELIFVDDGSTDKTKDIIYKYKEKFENNGYIFKYIYQPNAGLGSAINTGLKNITGEYLIWPDPDDWLTDNSIEKRVKFLEKNSDYGIVTSNANIYYSPNFNKSRRKIISNLDINNYKKNQFELILKHKSVFCPGCHMIRVSALKDVNPSLEIFKARRGQNFQMLLPICYKYNRYFIPQCLYNYVIYEDSMSRGDDTLEKVLKRQEGLTEIVVNTINNMNISENEKKYYINLYNNIGVNNIFNGFYLLKNKNELKKYYKIIKENNNLTLKIRIKHYLSIFNIFIKR